MEYISVMKKKSHRTGIRWFVFSSWFLTGFLLDMTEDRPLRFLILALIIAPLVLLLCYFEDWAVTFYKGKIIRNRLGRQRQYPWTEVQEVTSFRSATDGETICILFRDGKAFRFRREDENGEKAVKLILKHNSIRSI